MKTLKHKLPVWATILSTGLVLSGLNLSCVNAQSTNSTKSTGPGLSSAKIGVNRPQLMAPVNRLVDKIKAMRFTGDPDFDYVLLMRTHHQGEIDLAQEAAKGLNGADMKNMAQTMISRKQSEIDQLESTLKQIKPNKANQAYVQLLNQKIEAMKLNLQGGSLEKKLTGNIDNDYATIMLENQRDAIDLTQDYLQYGKNQALRTLAQQLVANAQKDNDQFKALIKP